MFIGWLLIALGLARGAPRPPPEGWTDLRTLPGLLFEVGYATAQNFTGAPLPGYGEPGAWLRSAPAAALAGAQRAAEGEGLAILVYDAYRPERASRAMVEWAKREGQLRLVTDGYVAARSRHNRGVAVDLTLARDGQPLDMGTPWDQFSEASHGVNAEGLPRENRDRLSRILVAAGFRPYSKEWWHFSWPADAAPIDIPYEDDIPDEDSP